MEEFKVGDVVRFKSWDRMVVEYGVGNSDSIKCRFLFTKNMRYLCGTVFVIQSIQNLTINEPKFIKDDSSWAISTDMIEKVDAKNELINLKAKIDKSKSEHRM